MNLNFKKKHKLKLKNNSGVLELRNTGDSAYLIFMITPRMNIIYVVCNPLAYLSFVNFVISSYPFPEIKSKHS